jgi:CDP-glucose 4,6-dehydratase
MEGLVASMPSGMKDFYRGKKVFLTGHTGFKGAWLAIMLKEMGAQVAGYSLPPATEPNLFSLAGLSGRMKSCFGDIRDLKGLSDITFQAAPEVVFHLAAQALVNKSYTDPVGNYSTNIMGTVNLLEACRLSGSVRSIVVVTSDKCYENDETGRAYTETDRLGGNDPYSSSKACAEIITHAYRKSFYSGPLSAGVASARAGNVIGGGDWAEYRLLPDCLRALEMNAEIVIRNPDSIRPWQHVLDPLHGYLLLAYRLFKNASSFSSSWNFGPDENACVKVKDLAREVISQWGSGECRHAGRYEPFKEACLLRLDNAKAKRELGWRPFWDVRKAVGKTVQWHKAYLDKADMYNVCCEQIKEHQLS